MLRCVPSSTRVNETPALADRATAAGANARLLERELEILSGYKASYTSRKWYYLHGALAWLRGETGEVEIDDNSMMEEREAAQQRWKLLREVRQGRDGEKGGEGDGRWLGGEELVL